MEIVIAVVVIGLIVYWGYTHFNKEKADGSHFLDTLTKPVEVAPVAQPVSTPEPAKCGCGRSQSGLCVGLHKLTPEEWSVHSDNPNKVKPAKKAPAKKPAAPRAPAKPRAKKNPAK